MTGPEAHLQAASGFVEAPPKRLNWGCGEHTAPGWLNVDVKSAPGIDLSCDIREGLPLESDSIDYAVSVHALQELTIPELVPALAELRRVLRPGGVLRLVLPDLEKAIRAYLRADEHYFQVEDAQAKSLGGRFIVHMLWHGYSRTLFVGDFLEELLMKAGFMDLVNCHYRQTASRFPDIVELDNRQRESLYMEATRPTGA